MTNMVIDFNELDLTQTQRYIVRDLGKMMSHIPITLLPAQERAFFSVLHHMTECAILDPRYIVEKLNMLFPEDRFEVK